MLTIIKIDYTGDVLSVALELSFLQSQLTTFLQSFAETLNEMDFLVVEEATLDLSL